ncbi:MAG: hypothetical protein VXW24_06240, partial [Bacteroidota bacterium]|nr:hypothetical protein [Bacteroidota bacterium]
TISPAVVHWMGLLAQYWIIGLTSAAATVALMHAVAISVLITCFILTFQVVAAIFNDSFFKGRIIELAVSRAWVWHLKMFNIDFFKTHTSVVTESDYFIVALRTFAQFVVIGL